MAQPGGKRGQGGGGEDEGPKISPEERARIARAARQVPSYLNFLRWSANFKKEELARHPRHDRVILLSPMQSGRFAFSIDNDTIYLGAQPFEMAWLAAMPLDKAYVWDRLYLSSDGVSCMDSKLPPLAFGIFVNDRAKRDQMARTKWLQLVEIKAHGGRVVSVEREIGQRVSVEVADIITSIAAATKARLQQQDMSRFL